MKWFIASDLHGSAYYTKRMLERFSEEGADRLLLLGDLLYHGPRNDLPRDYAPKEVISLLNGQKGKIFSIRGNCDCEVDQMVLSFPILSDSLLLPLLSHVIYATHGHLFSETVQPPLSEGDFLLFGHTHIPKCEKKNGIWLLNPGSVSIPKENSPHSYLLLEEGLFEWKDLEQPLPQKAYLRFSALA